MEKFRMKFTGVVLFVALIGSICFGQNPVTTGSLISEMTDLERLATLPEPSYEIIQFSSHDRRSDQPEGPGWFANSDGFGSEPIPNFQKVLEEPGDDGIGRYLICDVEGPGAVVRTWTAQINGTVDVFIDGSDTPNISTGANEFFKRTYSPLLDDGNVEPEIFQNTFSQRDAGYYPIPFRERLRVEWTGDLRQLHFYELEVRLYDKDTPVQSFSQNDLSSYASEITTAAQILNNPDTADELPESVQRIPMTATIGKGERVSGATVQGSQAIRELRLKIMTGDLIKALRQTILHITFDGAPLAQVQAPVGDFFGAAPGINPFTSLPFSVNQDGEMICRFVMPFRDSVTVAFENLGNQQVTVTGALQVSDYPWDPDRSMYFRARWRVDHHINNAHVFDLPFLAVRGEGVYVGTSSILYNPNNIPTPYGNWWGEGDEKIFIDDHRLPSFFGTGSEDYYNYSWSSPDIWQTPYAGQPRNDGPGNRGFVTNHRWHIPDPLPFRHSLHFYMEMFSHQRTDSISYARLPYHYARPGAIDEHVPISKEDVRVPERRYWMPVAAFGAANAIFFQTEDLVQGKANTSLEPGNLWAGGRLFVWHPREQKEKLTLTLPVEESGTYRLAFTVARTPNSGAVEVSLDGNPLQFGEENHINLHQPHRQLLRTVYTGTLQLEKGSHPLSLVNVSELPDRDVGIDFIWVQKRE